MRLTHHANVPRPRLCPSTGGGAGAAVPVAPPDTLCAIGPPTCHAGGAMALMAERIFLITAIVFCIVVPIAVMVALVHMN